MTGIKKFVLIQLVVFDFFFTICSDISSSSYLPNILVEAVTDNLLVKDDVVKFPVRDTTYGRVRGKVRSLKFLDGKKIERYLGIPYAKPPTKQMRFELPEPPLPWSGVREVLTVPSACPQINNDLSYIRLHMPDFSFSDMDEDCLYLNVYVPETTSVRSLLPVLVHVHGGSNEVGMGAMFHGDVLAALGKIIVVTFNYRLAAFGFLSGECTDLPGNFGLHDQTLALRWVSENIIFFNGDPSKVTLEGHSAGGNDVGQHLTSHFSKGLFRHAVMQSGSPLAYWAILDPDASTLPSTLGFADSLGCGWSKNIGIIKTCLKNLPWGTINNATYMHVPGLYNFSPLIDGNFIRGLPEKTIATLPLNGEAFFIGVTRDEGSLTAQVMRQSTKQQEKYIIFDNDSVDFLPPPVKAFSDVRSIRHLVLHEYTPWDDPLNETANLISLSNVVGDSTFIAPAIRLAVLLSRRNHNVYFYSFNHVSRLSNEPLWMGVPHGRDLFYLFGSPLEGHPYYRFTSADKNISRAIIDMWSNFVTYGRPIEYDNGNAASPVFAEVNQSYFQISCENSNVCIRQRLRVREVAFWNELLPKLHQTNKYIEQSQTVNFWMIVVIILAFVLAIFILVSFIFNFRRKNSKRCSEDKSHNKESNSENCL